ncbi:Amidase [uncultured Pleomorphomonas sp.]|uniref:Indoleacetamide hydrolase n=1 Tax=uncultured Pleomorphomonas sp. TaxID=442121 RepID=A0A212LG46_9HYPH|nr:amidase [uncultured Pleomorphomonas sp.]SCM76359.1 Amidase [uncultured Pleomorphomonas sp.]
MPIVRPTIADLEDIAAGFGMSFTPHELAEMFDLMQSSFDDYDLVDALPDPEARSYDRSRGYRPEGEENHLGAWARKATIAGSASGPLAGRTIVLKDNVALAGVPMMNGSSTLDGHVPALDATVVSRILDAGGTIVGKATCEKFCMSGGSHTSDPGPVHNPWRRGYSAGGSSSGCGALVASGEVDMAIGGDQGGSIRIPASYCGIYGLKPTHGLVPYTGIMPIEATLDHTGPMTASVGDNALLLSVIAGADGLDPRQGAPRLDDYRTAVGAGVAGLRIGLVAEGFAAQGMRSEVAEKVREAARCLAALGAVVGEISLPEHVTTASVWSPIGLEGLTQQMMRGNGMGFNWKGRYDIGLMAAHAHWRERANDLSPTLKLSMLTGEWGIRRYGGRYYAKAQNLARAMRAAYDRALSACDLLLMPTLPRVASPLPGPGAPLSEVVARAFELNVNTAPLDVTGHPAMSVPCGLVDGLPVGMMLIGRHFGEASIYRAAGAFEASGDWRGF